MSQFDTVMVGIAFLIGPDPDVTDYFAPSHRRRRVAAGQNTVAVRRTRRSTRCSQEGARTLRSGRAQGDLPEDAGDHPRRPALPADLPVRARCEGTRQGSRASTPNVNVRIESWNVAALVLGEPEAGSAARRTTAGGAPVTATSDGGRRCARYLLGRLWQSLVLLVLVSIIGFARAQSGTRRAVVAVRAGLPA